MSDTETFPPVMKFMCQGKRREISDMAGHGEGLFYPQKFFLTNTVQSESISQGRTQKMAVSSDPCKIDGLI